MTRRYMSLYRQAIPRHEFTRREHLSDALHALAGLFVLALVAIAFWLWMAIGTASQIPAP